MSDDHHDVESRGAFIANMLNLCGEISSLIHNDAEEFGVWVVFYLLAVEFEVVVLIGFVGAGEDCVVGFGHVHLESICEQPGL